jgi:hypothetical protein
VNQQKIQGNHYHDGSEAFSRSSQDVEQQLPRQERHGSPTVVAETNK